MKKAVLVFMLTLWLGLVSFSNPIPGSDTLRIDGKLALWLAGGNYENGFSYGHFLGDRIMLLFENYVINTAFGGAASYNYARQLFDQYFIVDEKYNIIAQGMIDGIVSSGVSLYSPTLNDDLTYKDVLIANAIPDFASFNEAWKNIGPGCSNISSWGSATAADPDLAGETVVSRNLDWVNNPYLINNPLIIIWAPSAPDEQQWISFGFIGLIGALSGLNEEGVITFQNMGNYSSTPVGTGFYPVNLAQRNGLEKNDYNGDGICSPRDVTDAVRDHNVAGSFIIHTAGKAGTGNPAEILEIHNSYGDTIRTIDQNPTFFGDNLVATNHFRLLKPPAYCYRYQRISDSLETSNQMNIHRNWSVLTTAGVTTNLQTIQFAPELHILRFSFAEIGIPAYQITPSEVWIDTIFYWVRINEKYSPGLDDLFVMPNPASDQTTIYLTLPFAADFQYMITDMNGCLITDSGPHYSNDKTAVFNWDTHHIRSGIYLCHLYTFDPLSGRTEQKTKKIVIHH